LPTLPASLALEKATNPFLRCNETGVIEAVSRQTGIPLENPVSVFAAVREWRNIG